MEEETMSAQLQLVGSTDLHAHHRRFVRPDRCGRVYATAFPTTRLLPRALAFVDWSDSYAVGIPRDRHGHDAQEWADAIFRAPPSPLARLLFGAREVLVRAVGIEPGGSHVFDTVARTETEVLLGVDQKHLGYRASVLVEPDRVVLSTVVQLRNRRGHAYFALVRHLHPLVVRGALARAARTMAATPVTRRPTTGGRDDG
jgi:Protein of unknown function (DUF2867)